MSSYRPPSCVAANTDLLASFPRRSRKRARPHTVANARHSGDGCTGTSSTPPALSVDHSRSTARDPSSLLRRVQTRQPHPVGGASLGTSVRVAGPSIGKRSTKKRAGAEHSAQPAGVRVSRDPPQHARNGLTERRRSRTDRGSRSPGFASPSAIARRVSPRPIAKRSVGSLLSILTSRMVIVIVASTMSGSAA